MFSFQVQIDWSMGYILNLIRIVTRVLEEKEQTAA